MRNVFIKFSVILETFLFALIFTAPCRGADATFVGKFSNGDLTVELTGNSDGYTGAITLADQKYPATANGVAQRINGTFVAGGNSLAFTATLQGDTLTLVSGGATYTLKRVGGNGAGAQGFNPLANGANSAPPSQPQNGSAPAAPNSNAPNGYVVVATTATGKSLATQKSNVNSVADALKATFPDLEGYFGSRPQIGSAFRGVQDTNSGGATFSDTFAGQPIRGVVSVQVQPGGIAAVNVVYCQTNAPRAEWETLMKPTQAQGDAGANGATAAANAPTPVAGGKEFDFPDGTGSIQVPDGWTVTGNSENHPVKITGPNDQIILLHAGLTVYTADSQMVQMRKRLDAQDAQRNAWFAQNGRPPLPAIPRPTLLVADFSDPATALKILQPQISAQMQAKGGPTSTIDQIVSTKDIASQIPNGKTQFVVYDVTRTNPDGTPGHYRTRAVIMCNPTQSQGMWQFFVAASMTARVDAMDAQLPLMRNIVNSNKADQQRMMQVAQAENEEGQKQLATLTQTENAQNQALYQMGQDNMRTQNDIYNQRTAANQAQYADERQQFKQYEWQKGRNSADFVEQIQGRRLIYDTVTGESGYADLSSAGAVVDSLNSAALDPNRFVQIPLRDQLYPNPP
jgi:hypothetical protein